MAKHSITKTKKQPRQATAGKTVANTLDEKIAEKLHKVRTAVQKELQRITAQHVNR